MQDSEEHDEKSSPQFSLGEWLNRSASMRQHDGRTRQDKFEHMDFGHRPRCRLRRVGLHISVPTLAGALSVSMKALTAYEMGNHRVSGERSMEIAKLLYVAPSFFFQNLPLVKREIHNKVDIQNSATLDEYLVGLDSLMISNIVRNIADRAMRLAIIEHAMKASGVEMKSERHASSQ